MCNTANIDPEIISESLIENKCHNTKLHTVTMTSTYPVNIILIIIETTAKGKSYCLHINLLDGAAEVHTRAFGLRLLLGQSVNHKRLARHRSGLISFAFQSD